MKNLLYLFMVAVMAIGFCGCEDTESEFFDLNYIIEIPDANFKAILTNAYLHDEEGFGIKGPVDANGDGEISVAEAMRVSRLDVQEKEIVSLEGIEYFRNLKYLHCGENPLKFLDVSKCVALEELTCVSAPLVFLNVSGCKALRRLYCQNTFLTALDVSGCTALKELSCHGNGLTSLNISECKALEWLNCRNNKLDRLDVSRCTALRVLECSDNRLTTLDISKHMLLSWLYCDPMDDESGNNLLSTIYVNKNRHGWEIPEETQIIEN